jgi:hypothetical protein
MQIQLTLVHPSLCIPLSLHADCHYSVDELERQRLSVREAVSKQVSEIDELKMELRVSEEKARLEIGSHNGDRNRMLLSHLPGIEQNHNEIASLFEQNRAVCHRVFGTVGKPTRLHTRIFTDHSAGKQRLRPH